jgi:hypothetical protein
VEAFVGGSSEKRTAWRINKCLFTEVEFQEKSVSGLALVYKAWDTHMGSEVLKS